MICDVQDLNKYYIYKKKTGPFVFTFYKKDIENKNYTLYKNLKRLEREFNNVPILRFDYDEFKKYYPMQCVPSPMHLLIIEKLKENIIIKATDLSSLRNVLENVNLIRFHRRKNLNTEYRFLQRFRERTWVVNTGMHKVKDIKEHLQKPVEMQYIFPNSTIALSLVTKSVSKIKKPQINKHMPQETKLPIIISPTNFKPLDTNKKDDDELNTPSYEFLNFVKLHKLPKINSSLHTSVMRSQNIKMNTPNMLEKRTKNATMNTNIQKCNENFKLIPSCLVSIPPGKIDKSALSHENSLTSGYRKCTFGIQDIEKKLLLNNSEHITMLPSLISLNNKSHLSSTNNLHISPNLLNINNTTINNTNISKNKLVANFENSNYIFNTKNERHNENNSKDYNNSLNSENSSQSNQIIPKIVNETEFKLSNENIFKLEHVSSKDVKFLSTNKYTLSNKEINVRIQKK